MPYILSAATHFYYICCLNVHPQTIKVSIPIKNTKPSHTTTESPHPNLSRPSQQNEPISLDCTPSNIPRYLPKLKSKWPNPMTDGPSALGVTYGQLAPYAALSKSPRSILNSEVWSSPEHEPRRMRCDSLFLTTIGHHRLALAALSRYCCPIFREGGVRFDF